MEDKELFIESSVGKVQADSSGAAIGAARIDPARAYIGIPPLLKDVIDSNSAENWSKIMAMADYTFEGVSTAMDTLDRETGFGEKVKKLVEEGQNLLFKPNIVTPTDIDPATHAPGNTVMCTPWAFIAALMRWFHDRLDISYHCMSLGEGATCTSSFAGSMTRMLDGKRKITSLAVIEGKSGDFYGGWGFYFARKYLADRHDPSHTDDPMNGYEESAAGTCLPPGEAGDKLMVYDLNKIDDDRSNGREVPVLNGHNYQNIILHKAIIGGDPEDPEDRKAWPGCVLINVPKLKVHVIELITAAVKNLGIGLYPMECNISAEPGKIEWAYGYPHKPIPGMKDRLPHSVWQSEFDRTTGKQITDAKGEPVWRKTGGMNGTMADVIQAVLGQDTYMIHVIDAIETTNGMQAGPATFGVSEGLVFASEDPVAVDLLASRYLFSNITLADAAKIQREQGLPDRFFREVPLPRYDGKNIVTGTGYDSPIWRYTMYDYCRERGIGQRDYYVKGEDARQGLLASVRQQLGRIENDHFSELMTDEFYFAVSKPVWDLQATALAYLKANDELEGTDRLPTVFDVFDENNDGVIDFTEKGKHFYSNFAGESTRMTAAGIDFAAMMKVRFVMGVSFFRNLKKEWNTENRDSRGIGLMNGTVLMAMRMSQAPEEKPDPFSPGLTYGGGKWPSFRFMEHLLLNHGIFGLGFPARFLWTTPYGFAFCYADYTYGEAKFTNGEMPALESDIIDRYHTALSNNAKPLPFTVYVPHGHGTIDGRPIPNVTETDDPARMFTASFGDGQEIWKEITHADFP